MKSNVPLFSKRLDISNATENAQLNFSINIQSEMITKYNTETCYTNLIFRTSKYENNSCLWSKQYIIDDSSVSDIIIFLEKYLQSFQNKALLNELSHPLFIRGNIYNDNDKKYISQKILFVYSDRMMYLRSPDNTNFCIFDYNDCLNMWKKLNNFRDKIIDISYNQSILQNLYDLTAVLSEKILSVNTSIESWSFKFDNKLEDINKAINDIKLNKDIESSNILLENNNFNTGYENNENIEDSEFSNDLNENIEDSEFSNDLNENIEDSEFSNDLNENNENIMPEISQEFLNELNKPINNFDKNVNKNVDEFGSFYENIINDPIKLEDIQNKKSPIIDVLKKEIDDIPEISENKNNNDAIPITLYEKTNIFEKEYKNYKNLLTDITLLAQQEKSQYNFIYEIVYKNYIKYQNKNEYSFDAFCKDVFGLTEKQLYNKLYYVDLNFNRDYSAEIEYLLNPENIGNIVKKYTCNIPGIQKDVFVPNINIGNPIMFDIEHDEVGKRTFNLIDHEGFKQLNKFAQMILSILTYEYSIAYMILRGDKENILKEMIYNHNIENLDKVFVGAMVSILSIIKTCSSFLYLFLPPKMDTLMATNMIYIKKDYKRNIEMINYMNKLFEDDFFKLENPEMMDDFKYYMGHVFKYQIDSSNITDIKNLLYFDDFFDTYLLHTYYSFLQLNGTNNAYKHVYSSDLNEPLINYASNSLFTNTLTNDENKELLKDLSTVTSYFDFQNTCSEKNYYEKLSYEFIEMIKSWNVIESKKFVELIYNSKK